MTDETQVAGAQEEHLTFQTEIQQLLQLMIHSLYTDKQIFLREIISNASDALNKIQFEQLTRAEIVSPTSELAIELTVDRDANTLTISDTGIGMTRQEIIDNLGTIARSGSRAFLETLKAAGKDANTQDVIGQFGVGFYSVFMVADKVVVHSRSYHPDETAVKWTSDGSGTYTVAPGERQSRGTDIVLHLKEEALEFLETWRLEDIVKRFSDYVSFPIRLEGRALNRQKALWLTPRDQITDEQYIEFYGHLNHDTRKPLTWLHLSFDVPQQFNAILYVPAAAPSLAWQQERDRHNVRLYARRVFIQESCKELLPTWLRFLVGVVDSADLPLNVSREMIQQNPLLGKIRQNLVRKVLGQLKTIANNEAEKYEEIWREFGRFFKQGHTEDYENREKIEELLRFNSSAHVDEKGQVSLATYVERMREDQKKIYYAHGTSRSHIERSPNLEALRKKGYEVLYMTDPVDGLLMSELSRYKDKEIQNVDGEGLDVKADPPAPEDLDSARDLAGFIKKTLGDRVEDVRLSERLVDSPVCLVNPDSAMSSDLQRLYQLVDKDFKLGKKILELNPHAPLIQDLGRMYDATRGDLPGQERLRPWAEQLLDMALLTEGMHPDPADMVPRMRDILTQAAAVMRGTLPVVENPTPQS